MLVVRRRVVVHSVLEVGVVAPCLSTLSTTSMLPPPAFFPLPPNLVPGGGVGCGPIVISSSVYMLHTVQLVHTYLSPL